MINMNQIYLKNYPEEMPFDSVLSKVTTKKKRVKSFVNKNEVVEAKTVPSSPKIMKVSKDYDFIDPVVEQAESPPFSDYIPDIEIIASTINTPDSSIKLRRQSQIRANYNDKIDRIYKKDTLDELNQSVLKQRQ